jgi:tripartite-type tricarboxylate transporter receptor subunit TctC
MLAFQQGTLALSNDQPANVRQPDLHVIAAFAPRRIADCPDAPTMRELGYDLAYSIWQGMFAPVATPAAVLDRLEAACAEAVRRPAVVEGFARINTPMAFRDRRALAAFVAAESGKFRALIEATGMRQAE